MYIKNELITRNKKGEITEINFTLSNGTRITAQSCYESWQQWGGTTEELGLTVDRLEELNPKFERDEIN